MSNDMPLTPQSRASTRPDSTLNSMGDGESQRRVFPNSSTFSVQHWTLVISRFGWGGFAPSNLVPSSGVFDQLVVLRVCVCAIRLYLEAITDEQITESCSPEPLVCREMTMVYQYIRPQGLR